MKTHLKILILLIVFSGGVMRSTDVFVGTEGQTVHITCQFLEEHKYKSKYFCYETCLLPMHVLIETDKTDEVVSAGRYSVNYNINTNTFTVTIRNLRLKDSGVYYCGINQWFRDTKKKVQLKVHPAPVIPLLITPAAAFNSTQTPTHTVSTHTVSTHTVSTWITTHTSADNSSSTLTVCSTISTSLVKSILDVKVICAGILVLLMFCVIVALVLLYRRRSNLKSRSSNAPISENPVPDPPENNQTIDVHHLYDEMMSEYSLAGQPEDDATVIYSIVKNCDPALQNDVNAVYSLIT